MASGNSQAREAVQRARWIVSQLVGWTPDDYAKADREATRRAAFEVNQSQRLNAV